MTFVNEPPTLFLLCSACSEWCFQGILMLVLIKDVPGLMRVRWFLSKFERKSTVSTVEYLMVTIIGANSNCEILIWWIYKRLCGLPDLIQCWIREALFCWMSQFQCVHIPIRFGCGWPTLSGPTRTTSWTNWLIIIYCMSVSACMYILLYYFLALHVAWLTLWYDMSC